MKVQELDAIGSSLAQKAFSLPLCNRRTIMHLIRLRVVREFGLPNEAVKALEDAVDISVQRQDVRLPFGGCHALPQRGRRSQMCRHRSAHLCQFQQPLEHSPMLGSALPGRNNLVFEVRGLAMLCLCLSFVNRFLIMRELLSKTIISCLLFIFILEQRQLLANWFLESGPQDLIIF